MDESLPPKRDIPSFAACFFQSDDGVALIGLRCGESIHSFALLMQAMGAKLTEIQKQLLHSNVATTGLYLETITHRENPFIGKLTALLGVREMMTKALTTGS